MRLSSDTNARFMPVLLSSFDEASTLATVCDSRPELRTGSRVMMLTVPAMADEPNSAEPPPRTTSTRSTMLAGICSSP